MKRRAKLHLEFSDAQQLSLAASAILVFVPSSNTENPKLTDVEPLTIILMALVFF